MKRAGKESNMHYTKTKKGSTNTEKTIKRVFMVTKIILCVMPFATLGYLSIGQQQYGLNYQQLLAANPVLTVTFLSAMCQPFAAWLLTITERRVESMDYSNALVSLVLIFIAECMLKNWLGIISTAILFWLVNKDMPYTMGEEFKKCANWKAILLDASGCVVLCLLAAFCLFASFRLG